MINESDLVNVKIRDEIYNNLIVRHIPCATGDSWVFEHEESGDIMHVSEGCTVVRKGNRERGAT